MTSMKRVISRGFFPHILSLLQVEEPAQRLLLDLSECVVCGWKPALLHQELLMDSLCMEKNCSKDTYNALVPFPPHSDTALVCTKPYFIIHEMHFLSKNQGDLEQY